MGFIVLGLLIFMAIIAFKKKMWFLFAFCCLLMTLGLLGFAYLVHFANTFSLPRP